MSRTFAACALGVALLASGQAGAQEATAASLPTVEADLRDDRPVDVPAPTAAAVSYYRSSHVVWAANQLETVAVPALVLLTGLAVAVRKRIPRWPLAVAAVFAVYSVTEWLLCFPLSYYAGFVRQHAYGLSNQTFGHWLREDLIGLVVNVVIGTLVVWVPFALMRRLPRVWWLASGALLVPFMFLVMLIQPIWIAPLTDDFGPMKDSALEARILSQAGRAGIDGGRVFEVAKSSDTKALNAYVTGFAGTKRIVLWDTLLAKLTPDETLVVMGHEMGHYVLRHVVTTIFAIAGLATLGFFLADRAARAVLARFGPRLGLAGPTDPAALPLWIALLAAVSIPLTPAAYALSRHNEHEADRFALEITHDNRDCSLAFLKMMQTNLGYPRPAPWVVWLRATHPPLGERIDFCNGYRPWQTGGRERYAELFRASP